MLRNLLMYTFRGFLLELEGTTNRRACDRPLHTFAEEQEMLRIGSDKHSHLSVLGLPELLLLVGVVVSLRRRGQ